MLLEKLEQENLNSSSYLLLRVNVVTHYLAYLLPLAADDRNTGEEVLPK